MNLELQVIKYTESNFDEFVDIFIEKYKIKYCDDKYSIDLIELGNADEWEVLSEDYVIYDKDLIVAVISGHETMYNRLMKDYG